MSKKMIWSSIILTLFAGGQMLAAWLLYDPLGNANLINTGWVIIFVSAVFGWLPIFTFRARGNIQGKSYTETTTLVDSGIYSIVRHPQYVAGILINLALPLITWHWLVILFGGISLGIYYQGTFIEEEENIQKFGSQYREYQQKVPRINFLLGLYRLLKRKEGHL